MGWIYNGRFVSAHDVGTARYGGRPTGIDDDPAYYPIFGKPKKPEVINIAELLKKNNEEEESSAIKYIRRRTGDD